MRSRIIEGVRAGEFAVVYQPQMMADGSRMVAVEALARWNHPTKGPIGPANFIAIAEKHGGIRELGAHVLRQACLDALSWPAIQLSVNVSALQLADPDFIGLVEATARETGLPLSRLELEIVETSLIKDFDAVVVVLKRLRAMGVRVALDDFGTGHSSLTYLRRLPLDKLKIDKSFVDGVDMVQSAAIVQAVVALARALGLKITAEGVETAEQARFLRICGCHYLQGYLFSRPVPASEITAMLGVRAA